MVGVFDIASEPTLGLAQVGQATNGPREMNVQDLDGHRLRMGADATGPSDGVDLTEGP